MTVRAEAVSEEEASAFVILAQVGWPKAKIARAMRRELGAVTHHLDRRLRELRVAREMRSDYESHH